MKRLKLLLAICVASLSLCFVGPKQNIVSTDAASISKPSVIEWDAENKIIYANLNSLLIVADGSGTTIYLEAGEEYSISVKYVKTDKEGKVIQQGTYEKGRLKSN